MTHKRIPVKWGTQKKKLTCIKEGKLCGWNPYIIKSDGGGRI